MSQHAISPTRNENYPQWYQAVIDAADLAENAPVRGCMIIKPWGYALWENIQSYLDGAFKATGHVNAYFPLLIPLSFLEKEAEHIEGFAKECAVVTHTRLQHREGTAKLEPASPLEEPYVIRPTSETVIGQAFSRWVQSHRDLPLKINQWCNVMRWEMRTRLFLRTSEFLWQEGHTAHASEEEARQETAQMLDVYADFLEDIAAIPVIKGEKTPEERFPGAVNTYTVEALMQDGKALQSGTSHFLGQTFSRSFDIQFTDKDGELKHVYTTSWGLSTRVIGGLIMTHSDDDGLVCPPRLAPQQIVIIPILRNAEERTAILSYCEKLAANLRALHYHGQPIRVYLDARDIPAPEKSWEYIKKGVPVRLEIGPRDMAQEAVFLGRRDRAPKDKQSFACAEFIAKATDILDEIQSNIRQRAREFLQSHTTPVSSLDAFMACFAQEAAPGFVQVYCHESADYLEIIKPLKVSARCIPLNTTGEGTCIFTGLSTTRQVIFAKSY